MTYWINLNEILAIILSALACHVSNELIRYKLISPTIGLTLNRGEITPLFTLTSIFLSNTNFTIPILQNIFFVFFFNLFVCLFVFFSLGVVLSAATLSFGICFPSWKIVSEFQSRNSLGYSKILFHEISQDNSLCLHDDNE